MKFVLSLRTGGLMEDPDWHYDGIKVVEAVDLIEAKQKYADICGLTNHPNWCRYTQTFWGWDIVEMVDEMKSLQNQ